MPPPLKQLQQIARHHDLPSKRRGESKVDYLRRLVRCAIHDPSSEANAEDDVLGELLDGGAEVLSPEVRRLVEEGGAGPSRPNPPRRRSRDRSLDEVLALYARDGYAPLIDEVVSAPRSGPMNRFRCVVLSRYPVLLYGDGYEAPNDVSWRFNSARCALPLSASQVDGSGQTPRLPDSSSVVSPRHRTSFWFRGRGHMGFSHWGYHVVRSNSGWAGAGSSELPPDVLGAESDRSFFVPPPGFEQPSEFGRLLSDPSAIRWRDVVRDGQGLDDSDHEALRRLYRARDIDPVMVQVGRRLLLLSPRLTRLIPESGEVSAALDHYELAASLGAFLPGSYECPDPLLRSSLELASSSPLAGDVVDEHPRLRGFGTS